MKKSTLLIIVLIAFAGIANAQKSKLIGSWLMTKAEVGSQIQTPYFVTEFKEDGNMVVMGIDAGTWDYNKASNAIVMKSELDKDFNGEGKITNLTEKELIVTKDGSKLTYLKVNKAEIIEANKNSGLMGMWKFKDVPYPEVTTSITFTEPDEYTIIEKEANSTGKYRGTWIFDKQEMSLIIIGLNGENGFRGKNKVIKISDETFEFENKGNVFTAQRKVQNTQKIEHLTFTGNEFYNENGDYKYEADEEKLPWRDWNEKKNNILGVKQLVYNYATLNNDTELFDTKTLTADVKATLEEEGFVIDNIFNGYDRYNLPEDSEFPENLNFTALLYPLEEDVFRVVGNEQITTPAGTFDCTVLEGLSYDNETMKKLWLINDKIGVYAKIIEDNPDETWGHYSVYELQEIK